MNYSLAYVYARGYFDGRAQGYTDMDKDWMTDQEKEVFEEGFQRGVSDYCEFDERLNIKIGE